MHIERTSRSGSKNSFGTVTAFRHCQYNATLCKTCLFFSRTARYWLTWNQCRHWPIAVLLKKYLFRENFRKTIFQCVGQKNYKDDNEKLQLFFFFCDSKLLVADKNKCFCEFVWVFDYFTSTRTFHQVRLFPTKITTCVEIRALTCIPTYSVHS